MPGFGTRWGLAMKSSDTDAGDEPGPDSRLSECLRSLPVPATPQTLESRVRTRIRRRRIARAALASGSALTVVVAILAWQAWFRPGEGPIVQHTPLPVAQPPSREIPSDELDVLFAPPPVDSLAIVGGRNESWVAALNRLGGMK